MMISNLSDLGVFNSQVLMFSRMISQKCASTAPKVGGLAGTVRQVNKATRLSHLEAGRESSLALTTISMALSTMRCIG
jgi:hypothetical protein